MNFKRRAWKILPLLLIGVALMSAVLMVLWNWLMPSLFVGVQHIDYVQSVGLLILSKLLFGGVRGRGGWHHRHDGHPFKSMNDEERENFRNLVRSHRAEAP